MHCTRMLLIMYRSVEQFEKAYQCREISIMGVTHTYRKYIKVKYDFEVK